MKELLYKTEKHDYWSISKSTKIDSDFYGDKFKSLNTIKTIFLKFELLITLSSTVTSSTLSIDKPSIGIPIASSSAPIISVAILIKTEYTSNQTYGLQNARFDKCI